MLIASLPPMRSWSSLSNVGIVRLSTSVCVCVWVLDVPYPDAGDASLAPSRPSPWQRMVTASDGRLCAVLGGSGAFAETILAYSARELYPKRQTRVDCERGRNKDFVGVYRRARSKPPHTAMYTPEYVLRDVTDDTVLLRFATAYGFRNIQNVVRDCRVDVAR